MKHIFSILLVLVFSHLYGQFAIVNDPEGFVFVRKTPEISKNIIDTIPNGQVFFRSYEPTGNWYEVEYGNNFYGYIYKSRIKLISDFNNLSETQIKRNNAVFKSATVKVTLTKIPFDPAKNVIQYSTSDEIYGGSFLEKINGKDIWGTDGEMPKNQYNQILIEFENQKIELPKESYNDLFEPNFNQTKIYLDKVNNVLYLTAYNSDGAGGYSVVWVVEKGKYKYRQLSRMYA